jgi:hypothetical protein
VVSDLKAGNFTARQQRWHSKIHVELKAKGDRGTANVELDIAEDDGAWKIERSSVDGLSMLLDH